jgi:hypothetical protein
MYAPVSARTTANHLNVFLLAQGFELLGARISG